MLRALVLCLLVAANAVALVAPAPWGWPVDPPRTVVRAYLAPATPYSAGHRGTDLGTSTGTLYAPTDGVVHFAGVVVDRPVLSIATDAGALVSFEPVVSTVAEGARVARGQVIGTVIPGHCSQLCVHVGVRVAGRYVSPMAWLGELPASVLLPTRRSVAAGTMSAWHSRMTRPARTSRPPTSGGPGCRRTTPPRRASSWSRGRRQPDDPP